MNKYTKWKILLVLLVAGLAFWRAYPPLDIHDTEGVVVTEGKINMGLDLQGGMHVILKVDTSELPKKAREGATERALEIIRNRIDQFGVLEPSIQREGKDRIIVQLPGITDRDRALELIGRTAHLEFKLVSDDVDALKKALDGEKVEGYELKYEGKTPLLLEEKASLTGDTIVDASVEFSQGTFGEPYVSLTLNGKGARIFSEVTGKNVRKQLAIVLDGNVHSSPVINEKIPSGKARITGRYSVEEANDLAIVLRIGALPAPIEILEERTVGASLGKDSVERGLRAIMIGGICVIGFMVLYYLLTGLVANIALILNMVIIAGALSYFGATLTLPGIAGLLLTIGMAVDANVLIFERIREESKLGKTLRGAVKSGYSKAFWTILDSNVTTLITALILFQFGTGPIRGFATTLSVGILSSMFCALVVTRLVLDLLTSGGKIKKFVMLQFVKQPKINFLGKRRIAYLISLVLIVSGMVVFASRGGKNFGIDFTGGALQQFKFTEAVNIEDVRAPLGEMGLGDALVQQFGGDKEFIIRTDKDVSDMLIAKFKEVFGEDSHELVRVEKVGPAIGKDLRGKALMALFWAMVGICIYISIRFEFRFAIAAIVALLHDVLISVGVLSITGRELSLPVIAALLTIVGYSINDTIVIFDRIREDRHIMRKADYKTIINTSINQTLSRTILTSLTTLLVVMALYLLGGEVINDFAFVLMVGVMAGTYSSIFVASPILIDWPGARRK